MEHALAEADLREKMKAAGPIQAQGFSWQRTARRTVDCYRHALAGGGGEGRV